MQLKAITLSLLAFGSAGTAMPAPEAAAAPEPFALEARACRVKCAGGKQVGPSACKNSACNQKAPCHLIKFCNSGVDVSPSGLFFCRA